MRTALRRSGWVAGVLVAGVTLACQRDTAVPSDDLASDLKSAASSDGGLTLAPSSAQGVTAISPLERGRVTAAAPARSQRATVYHKSVTSRHVAPVTPVEETAMPAAVEAPVAAPQTASAPTPSPSPTPRPHDISGPGSAQGDGAGPQTGDGAGSTIGTILGVIIRGGVVGDDHCDPRTDSRGRRGGGIISGMPGGVIRYEAPVQPSQPGRTTVLRGASY